MSLLDKARNIQDQMVEWRRDFHKHPELGFQEFRTSGRVAEICTGLGMHVRSGVGKTGVVADIGTGKSMIAVRADMDALPISETEDRPYRSLVPGIMHACGHDAHVSMALGAASLLKNEQFHGTVRFIFQPAEEVADEEGLSGSTRMLNDGALEGVDLIIAQHVDPSTPVGVIRNDPGPTSGGVDSWFATIQGKGGHGARPYNTCDPIYMSAHVIMALNAMISRRIHPFEPVVVSIGAIHAGQAENVIPDQVEINGTLRFTSLQSQQLIHAEIRRAFELVRPLGGDFDLHIEIGSPPMVNDLAVVNLINSTAVELLGDGCVLPERKELDAEDFGVFSEKVPGAMYMLGARIDKDERYGHNPRFDIDERCLTLGAALLAGTAMKYLNDPH